MTAGRFPTDIVGMSWGKKNDLGKFQDNDAAQDHDRLTALRVQILGNISANHNHIRQLRCR